MMMDIEVESSKIDGAGETNPSCSAGYSGMVHSKKVIKHALRQQAKRRRKNTTIASGNSRTLPRIVVKPLAPPPAPSPPPPPNDPPSIPNMQHSTAVEEPAATMREVLASLPGFSLKSSRRRSTKRLSAAAQLEAGLVDLESPASILASTSLRALLNRHTFQGLPPLYQRKLAQLLPAVDRQDAATSGLNNEFFSRACLEWRKRLAEGEFTPENQQRLKMEAEKDKNKLDPWKLKHFEPIWGEKREPKFRLGLHCMNEPRTTGGAVTRSSLRLRLESSNQEQSTPELFYRPAITTTITEKIEETNSTIRVTDPPALEIPVNVQDIPREPLAAFKETLIPEVENSKLKEMKENIEETVITNGGIEKEENEEEYKEKPEKIEITVETDEVPMEISQPDIPVIIQHEEDVSQKESEIIANSGSVERIQLEEQTTEVSIPVIEKSTAMIESSVTPTMIVTTTELDHAQELSVATEQIECQSQDECDTITELTMSLSQVSEIQVLQEAEDHFDAQFVESSTVESDKIFEISECENAAAVESITTHKSDKSESLILEEHGVINVQINTETINTNSTDSEVIPDAMEIDSETLQRIHELEVRGEMREAYEEISGCTEEIIYPILEGMEMGSNESAEETCDTQEVTAETTEEIREQTDMVESNEDDELCDANNYVCSEMLACSWPVDATTVSSNSNTTIDSNSAQEDLQVPWPLVAAALDGSVAANITVTTQEECNNDTCTTTDSTTSNQQAQQQQTQFVNETTTESINCISLPVIQSTPFQPDTMTITTPATNCLLKNVQTTQSPPIIAFPPLQSIRFVPTRLHTGQNTTPTATALTATSTLPARIPVHQHQSAAVTNQVSIARSEEIVQLSAAAQGNVVSRVNAPSNNISIRSNQIQRHQHVQATVGVTAQGHSQSAIVVQHQTPIPVTQSRPIVANMQPQQFSNTNVAARSTRTTGPGGYRGSRNGNKEQNSGRSRSSTKEPPGAVNLERSYQICQAVIQSSPNRDQLKAHLKPPPSLLARGDGAFTTSKSGGRTVTTVKSQKTHQTSHQNQKSQNKTQAVMLRQVFATTRQPAPVEVTENSNASVAQIGTNGPGNFGQYILVQRTGVNDSAPRASSAPPLPPQIASIGVGVHLVRGRPASAGEGSHQAVTLKARGTSDGRGSGGAEPGAPGIIMGGDPPPPCECNIRGAMVICRQCGAFCHDDCIGPQRICATCLIR